MSVPHDLRALLRNPNATAAVVARGLESPMGETVLVRDGGALRVFHRDSFVNPWAELAIDASHPPTMEWQDFSGELHIAAADGNDFTLQVGSFEREAVAAVLAQSGDAPAEPPATQAESAYEPEPPPVQEVADVLARERPPSAEPSAARPADSVRRAAHDGGQPSFRPREFHQMQRADGTTVPVHFHGVNPIGFTCPFVLLWGAACFVGLWHLEGMARVALIDLFEWWWLLRDFVHVIAKGLAIVGGLYLWIKGIIVFDKALDRMGYSPLAEFKPDGLEIRGPRNQWRQFFPYGSTQTVWQTRRVVSGGKNKSVSHQCLVLLKSRDADVALFGDVMAADFREKLPGPTWHEPEKFEPHPRQCAFPAASLVTMLQRWAYLTGVIDKDLSLEAGGQKGDARGRARKSGR